jgi:hypothetical protein
VRRVEGQGFLKGFLCLFRLPQAQVGQAGQVGAVDLDRLVRVVLEGDRGRLRVEVIGLMGLGSRRSA